jgi:hypothetical protein
MIEFCNIMSAGKTTFPDKRNPAIMMNARAFLEPIPTKSKPNGSIVLDVENNTQMGQVSSVLEYNGWKTILLDVEKLVPYIMEMLSIDHAFSADPEL